MSTRCSRSAPPTANTKLAARNRTVAQLANLLYRRLPVRGQCSPAKKTHKNSNDKNSPTSPRPNSTSARSQIENRKSSKSKIPRNRTDQSRSNLRHLNPLLLPTRSSPNRSPIYRGPVLPVEKTYQKLNRHEDQPSRVARPTHGRSPIQNQNSKKFQNYANPTLFLHPPRIPDQRDHR